jgi:hypothetical protein
MQSSLLFESLFKRNINDAGNAEYLKRIAEEHPYFSFAQFYLLRQENPGTEDYNKQALKAGVLFNNPYWLNFQLLQTQQTATPADLIVEDDPGNISVSEDNSIVQNEIQENKEIESANEKKDSPQQGNIIKEEMLFEPLYTTDYFASQGIKLTEEVQPTDKLGKQLKSFTDWLKTMKKINPDKIQIDHSAQTDASIQTLAEKSNTEGEVITETMAEIFIQQGKAEKAVETYQKLSLLNPSKSAYFAAKIEQLKGH